MEALAVYAHARLSMCLAGAPLNHAGATQDVSRADHFFPRLCGQRAWRVDETASKFRLMELSSKAKENGENYAVGTAGNSHGNTRN
jgi:hypothetical protein